MGCPDPARLPGRVPLRTIGNAFLIVLVPWSVLDIGISYVGAEYGAQTHRSSKIEALP